MRLLCVLASLLLAATCQMAAQQTVVQPGAPGAPSRTLPPSTTAKRPAVSSADVEFMQGMIMHHQQAVEMSELIPSRTSDKGLLDLGHRISLSQQDEIKFMRRWLEVRGQPPEMQHPQGSDDGKQEMHDMGMHDGMPMAMHLMPGMLTPEQMKALSRARDREFDRLFLAGMIQHHGGALTMVKELFDTGGSGQDGEIFDFATDVDNTQRAEIRLMEKMLKERN